jgi:hypothetical protein
MIDTFLMVLILAEATIIVSAYALSDGDNLLFRRYALHATAWLAVWVILLTAWYCAQP